MINQLTLVIVGILSLIGGWIIGSIRQKRKAKKILTQGTGRFGIIDYSYGDCKFTLEIEELEEAGSLTKVRLIRTIKSKGSSSYSIDDLLGYVKFKEWTTTSNITWYNNNSQKMRDNKINQILGTTTNP